jgi:hypothetical protein
MTEITEIIAGLKTNLQTIPGLRVEENLPEMVNPPVAIVALADIEYDGAFNRGMTTYNFDVTVIVGRADSRGAQRSVLGYASPVSASSIKVAIESNRNLDGLIYDLRVTQLRNIGSVVVNDTTYIAADFSVVCYAN